MFLSRQEMHSVERIDLSYVGACRAICYNNSENTVMYAFSAGMGFAKLTKEGMSRLIVGVIISIASGVGWRGLTFDKRFPKYLPLLLRLPLVLDAS